MALVREVIVEAKDKNYEQYIWHQAIDATILSLNRDQRDRVIDILKTVQEVCAEEDGHRRRVKEIPNFEHFMDSFIVGLAPERNSIPIRRFLTLRREELNNGYRSILEVFCLSLVYYLRSGLDDPVSKKLLVDLIGQRSLLTAAIFVKAFLGYGDGDVHQVSLVMYGWRKAIAEGLKDKYPCGGEELWDTILSMFPGQFSSVYPGSEGVLAKFKTKQELEKEWAERNAPALLKQYEGLYSSWASYNHFKYHFQVCSHVDRRLGHGDYTA